MRDRQRQREKQQLTEQKSYTENHKNIRPEGIPTYRGCKRESIPSGQLRAGNHPEVKGRATNRTTPSVAEGSRDSSWASLPLVLGPGTNCFPHRVCGASDTLPSKSPSCYSAVLKPQGTSEPPGGVLKIQTAGTSHVVSLPMGWDQS